MMENNFLKRMTEKQYMPLVFYLKCCIWISTIKREIWNQTVAFLTTNRFYRYYIRRTSTNQAAGTKERNCVTNK